MPDPTPPQDALKARLVNLALILACAVVGFIGARLGAPPEAVREVQEVIRSEGAALGSALAPAPPEKRAE